MGVGSWELGVGSWELVLRFVSRVCLSFAHEEDRKQQTQQRKCDARIKRYGTQAIRRREVARRQRLQRHGEVARRFVQAHRQAAPLWADQINFHDDGR